MRSDRLDDETFAAWADDLASWVLDGPPSDTRLAALAELFASTAAAAGWSRILTAVADNIADCSWDKPCSRAQELELQVTQKYANLRADELRKLAERFNEIGTAEGAEDAGLAAEWDRLNA